MAKAVSEKFVAIVAVVLTAAVVLPEAVLAQSSLGAAAAATVKAAFGLFDSLPTLAKVAMPAIAAAAAMFAFSRLRNTASNNIRRARGLHEQAALLHETGDEEGAKLLLERSNYHREKAYEQMRQQNPFAEKGLSKTGK